MKSPTEELSVAIIKLKEEIVELQDALHNLTAALLDGVFD